jgi:hypothetical protein
MDVNRWVVEGVPLSRDPSAGGAIAGFVGGGGEMRGMAEGSSLLAPATIDGLHDTLGRAARRGGGDGVELDDVDIEAAVNAGVAHYADDVIVGADGLVRRGGAEIGEQAAALAEQVGAAVGRLRGLGWPAAASRPADWSRFGRVIPVLAGSAGAGASVVAAALCDALQCGAPRTDAQVLLVDAADPPRSGLAAAARVEGSRCRRVDPHVAIRYSWRAQTLVARLESGLAAISPGMVPAPPLWAPPVSVSVTVADLGHDGWRATGNPLVGAGGWLRSGVPSPWPVLVVRATRPSLRHAEQVLARLERWITAGAATRPVQLVVTGAKRWPAGVAGVAGYRLQPLIDAAMFLPHDQEVETGGVTDEPLPDRLLERFTPLLTEWGLAPLADRRTRRGHR